MWPPADKTITDLAREQTLEIYHHHEPPRLPDGAAEKVDTILSQADSELK
jgi:hypothetical protein